MQYRAIPGTQLRISEIGFGCGGNAGLMVRGSPAEQRHVISRALELGVNYFDTAPDYGAGAAEQALGDALKAVGASQAIVTTKVEVRRNDLDDIASHVERSARDSLRRLGRDRIDILQIHNGPTAVRPAMERGDYHHLWIDHFLGGRGATEGLRRVLEDGIVGHVGFVCRGDDVAQVRTLLDTGLFNLINLPYSLINPSAAAASPVPAGERDYGGVLEAAQQGGCGVAVFSPLAGGRLSGQAPQHALARARLGAASSQGRAERFGFLARTDRSLAQAAYQFVLSHPGVTTAIGGFSSADQLEEIAAVSGEPPIPAEATAEIEAIWRSPRGEAPA